MRIEPVTLVGLLVFVLEPKCGHCFLDTNGFEAGLVGTLKGIMGELGNILNDVASGVKKLNKGIRTVEEFLDATIDEDCHFSCRDGSVPKGRKGYIAGSNGCGSFGLEEYINSEVLPLSSFVDCCNVHDKCYGTCGEDKDDCDISFKKCLYSLCRKQRDEMSKLQFKGCQAGAKLLYTGTTALGCKPYVNAQREACICPHETDHDEL